MHVHNQQLPVQRLGSLRRLIRRVRKDRVLIFFDQRRRGEKKSAPDEQKHTQADKDLFHSITNLTGQDIGQYFRKNVTIQSVSECVTAPHQMPSTPTNRTLRSIWVSVLCT